MSTDREAAIREANEVGKWLGATNAPVDVIAAQERVAAELAAARDELDVYIEADNRNRIELVAAREHYEQIINDYVVREQTLREALEHYAASETYDYQRARVALAATGRQE